MRKPNTPSRPGRQSSKAQRPEQKRSDERGGKIDVRQGTPAKLGATPRRPAKSGSPKSQTAKEPDGVKAKSGAAQRNVRPPRPGSGPPRPARSEEAASPSEPMRIARAMARAGLCSRREAERWIAEGRVSVNGKRLATPACEVGPGDKVLVDGRPLPAAEPPRMWRYHKPRGLVTTHADPEGRPTVFDNLPDALPRVISVGRLDFNTEGLLLLTNDGALARYLELPATGWVRRYRVRAHGRVTQADLDKLKVGIEIDGARYGPVEASVDTLQGGNIWITMALREGKNREVRRILEHLGLQVNRLIRVSYGPFQLLDLKPGEAEPIKRRVLADQLGTKVAAELGLDRPDLVEARSGRRSPSRSGRSSGGNEA
ncbi:MAG: pseudouridine synthase [Hyphomicrobiaceae bacterium]